MTLVITCSRLDRRVGYYTGDSDYDYSAKRLTSELTEPLPKYELPQPVPPTYTECSQIICINN
ncbi:hypothetical protein CONCODRAFT_2581 [Conidiobolus coronatus NRRL 28638]|uniref:Uncharacterized protein n=1 Tax=Conidiobolus coronatus (strain ATCC 28846 / CBS 209.66 / NRRL 28638) TaxID=796925 RepID=A0A137PH98_CONC2|nr:hypothetical protein CONCODRAFT_2581 [Conidiobolus coronatus NRRL 28638]|eukprot:KXN74377.1 hypothetical protein CONCODRAFT_2581 [Conidiobolus coronatus NRRL 28638]